MTISEFVKHIINIDIKQLIQEIEDHFQTHIEEYGKDADINLLSQIQRLKNLADLLDHKRQTCSNRQIPESPMSFGQNFNVEESVGRAGGVRTQPKSSINEILENFGKEKHLSQSSDPYQGQSTGDIRFAASILPYKPRYIRELCQKSIIPHSKPAGKYIFIRKELETWMKQNHLENDNSKFEIGNMGCK